MITTGYPYDNGVYSEVIDVNNSNVTCETSLPDFPLEIAYATGGLLMGRPLICGGESNNSRCYFLDNLDFIDLSQPRIGSDGIVLNETMFFIIGGARNFTDTHCLGTLAWRRKMFWYGDYYRSQIYAFSD